MSETAANAPRPHPQAPEPTARDQSEQPGEPIYAPRDAPRPA